MDIGAHARIALAHAAAESADYARTLVAAAGDDGMAPGALIRAVRRLRLLDLVVLDRSVLVERASGASWEQIAEGLGLPVDATIARYQGTYDEWVTRLIDPEPAPALSAPGLIAGSIADLDPEGTAVTLDAWYSRHAEPTDPEVERPVSRVLA